MAIGGLLVESTQELATPTHAPFASMHAKRKQLPFKFRWLLLAMILWATATASGYAQTGTYHPRKSWEYHPRNFSKSPENSWEYHPRASWKYHPKKSWKYHPEQEPLLLVSLDTEKGAYRITSTNDAHVA